MTPLKPMPKREDYPSEPDLRRFEYDRARADALQSWVDALVPLVKGVRLHIPDPSVNPYHCGDPACSECDLDIIARRIDALLRELGEI